MARTAPVPNIPAIPGMNPGIFVMGGGGGGGGGSGKGGSGAGGDQGADGQGGGDGANGAGGNAGACGPGSGAGCMNPAHGGGGGTQAGDPIDPVSGRVFIPPETDLPLVGPLIYHLQRGYSSTDAERDVGLGHGWSHSLEWGLELGRRRVVLKAPFAPARVIPLEPGQETVSVPGLGDMVITKEGVLLGNAKDLTHRFAPVPGAPQRRFRLVGIYDGARNRIELEYAKGQLTALVDSAGRRGNVVRDGNGRIRRFELIDKRGTTVWFRTYAYDERGDLTTIQDAAGQRTDYAYDDRHRLTRVISPTGRMTHYVYDDVGRCTETWVDYGDRDDPALADDLPPTLADGHTPAKGMLHVRVEYEEDHSVVIDTKQSRRLDHAPGGKVALTSGVWTESVDYDEAGRIHRYGDPLGHTVQFDRDEHGRVIMVDEPDGAQHLLAYDERGYLKESVNALGEAVSYAYDATGNLLSVTDAFGTLLDMGYDPRGLRTTVTMPQGATTKFEHDGESNLVAVVEPDGGRKSIEVDDIGRIIGFVDQLGRRTTYTYDAMNRLVRIAGPGGAGTHIGVDAEGRMVSMTTADGGTYRVHWAGFNSVHQLDLPDGRSLHYRYDRQGQLVLVVDERGERHEIGRDLAGRIVAERFADGRHYRYVHDAAGRLVRHDNGADEPCVIERDPVGRVTKRTYHDASEETFEYDPEGRLVASANGEVGVQLGYDDRAYLVREQVLLSGDAHSVFVTRNAAGQMSALAWDGQELRHERDLMGRAVRLELPGGGTIQRTFDLLGREVLRELPGGASVVTEYAEGGAMLRRRVVGPGGAGGAGAPWTGAWPEGTRWGEQFHASPGGDLLERWTHDGDHEVFGYDALGRIIERRVDDRRREAFEYAGAGCFQEVEGPARTYGPGGRIDLRGDASYRYDAEARRIAKLGADGEWFYHWDGRGMLEAVDRPDGTTVRFVYDADGRRLKKTIELEGRAVRESDFIWWQGLLIEELDYEVVDGTLEPRRQRTYVHDDAGAPLAHRDVVWTDGEASPQDWVHYLPGPADMPAALISGRGEVLSKVDASVWGQASFEGEASTPVRYFGQYYDDDIELSYQRFRYYDPELGQFINADPSGLQGGTSAFEYARSQPFRFVDPLGLQPVTTTITTNDGTTSTGVSARGAGRDDSQGMHPVVWQSLADRGPVYQHDRGTGGGSVSQNWPAGRHPATCGEPEALSNHIRNWEQQHNNGQPLNPNDPRDRSRIQDCLGSISSISSQHADGTPRAPCPNCTQLFSNLQQRWGQPSTASIQPGFMNSAGTGPMTNHHPPRRDWQTGHASPSQEWLGSIGQYQ